MLFVDFRSAQYLVNSDNKSYTVVLSYSKGTKTKKCQANKEVMVQ